ncbi:MAG: tyrosine-type recombinase/integrase [Lachnospiraceae bacterium]|nr:tyrosine-type recombinase/integrase [Lachnospiraceae bacterium]
MAASVSTKGIKCLPGKNVGSLAYTPEEALRIVGHIIESTNVYFEAICFAFYVGRRFNEISDLKWSDLVNDRVLVISHGNTESGNLKNGSDSVHKQYLCDEAYNLLKRYKAERPDSEWIFPNKAGNRIFNNRLNENLKKICGELGITYRSSHKIRAYAITQVSSVGNIESTREFAGHTDYRMTQRYINNAITEANKKTTAALNLGIQTISDHHCNKEKTS